LYSCSLLEPYESAAEAIAAIEQERGVDLKPPAADDFISRASQSDAPVAGPSRGVGSDLAFSGGKNDASGGAGDAADKSHESHAPSAARPKEVKESDFNGGLSKSHFRKSNSETLHLDAVPESLAKAIEIKTAVIDVDSQFADVKSLREVSIESDARSVSIDGKNKADHAPAGRTNSSSTCVLNVQSQSVDRSVIENTLLKPKPPVATSLLKAAATNSKAPVIISQELGSHSVSPVSPENNVDMVTNAPGLNIIMLYCGVHIM
jgi:hypothetical protein